MKVIIVKNYEEMSQEAARIIENQITSKPDSVLGLATGGTPERMYELLIESNKNGLSWSKIKTFNLDEYEGIPATHEMSYKVYMDKKLFNHLDINHDNIHIPSGVGDIEANGAKYDNQILVAGGIDLQILGIGENAHIAFNEPGSSEIAGTSKVNLTESTINANSRYFKSKDNVPKSAITMGIGSILKAKKIILLASGSKKAQAIKDTINGKVNRVVPSSFLQKHNNVTLIIDEEAASLLKK